MGNSLPNKLKTLYIGSVYDKEMGEIPLFVTDDFKKAFVRHVELVKLETDKRDFEEKINAPNRYAFIFGGKFCIIKLIQFNGNNKFSILSEKSNKYESPYSYHASEEDAILSIKRFMNIDSITTKADGSRIVDVSIDKSKNWRWSTASRYIIRTFNIK